MICPVNVSVQTDRARNLRHSPKQQDDKSSDLPCAPRLPCKLKLHVVGVEREDLSLVRCVVGLGIFFEGFCCAARGLGGSLRRTWLWRSGLWSSRCGKDFLLQLGLGRFMQIINEQRKKTLPQNALGTCVLRSIDLAQPLPQVPPETESPYCLALLPRKWPLHVACPCGNVSPTVYLQRHQHVFREVSDSRLIQQISSFGAKR